MPRPVPGHHVLGRLIPHRELVERPDAQKHLEAAVVAEDDPAEVRGLCAVVGVGVLMSVGSGCVCGTVSHARRTALVEGSGKGPKGPMCDARTR